MGAPASLDIPESAPRPGDVLADKYRVERVLGVGGMGIVLQATHLALHERVAIKMLLPSLVKDQETVERFVREGRAAAKIRSPHVARVLDVGTLAEGAPYLVMEYLEGADLADVLHERGPLPTALAVDYVLQACEAVAEAHAAKIVHRDLKPSNLFLARSPSGEAIKLLDFGVSKMTASDGDLSMTRTKTMLGSPLYMSPEQLKSSRAVDERSDIWSIGVILYELVSGRVPFEADTIAELGAAVLSGHAPSLTSVAPGVPGGLAEVVATCLRRSPEHRFVNLADFADAIAPFGSASAKESAARIVKTLGLPSVRATRVSHAALASTVRASSDPDLGSADASDRRSARTLPLATPSAIESGALSFGMAASAGGQLAQSSSAGKSPRTAATLAVAVAAAASLIVGGAILLARAKSAPESRAPTSPPVAAATGTPAPAPPTTDPAPTAPASAEVAPASVAASAAPRATHAASRPSTKSPPKSKPSTTGVAPAVEPTSPPKPKPASPSGIATSSKD